MTKRYGSSKRVEAIKEKLRAIDVNRLTPIEALLKLNELLKLAE